MSGAWYAYQEERIGQGRENAKEYLKEHSEVAATVEQQLRHALRLTAVAAESPAGADLKDVLWNAEGQEA